MPGIYDPWLASSASIRTRARDSYVPHTKLNGWTDFWPVSTKLCPVLVDSGSLRLRWWYTPASCNGGRRPRGMLRGPFRAHLHIPSRFFLRCYKTSSEHLTSRILLYVKYRILSLAFLFKNILRLFPYLLRALFADDKDVPLHKRRLIGRLGGGHAGDEVRRVDHSATREEKRAMRTFITVWVTKLPSPHSIPAREEIVQCKKNSLVSNDCAVRQMMSAHFVPGPIAALFSGSARDFRCVQNGTLLNRRWNFPLAGRGLPSNIQWNQWRALGFSSGLIVSKNSPNTAKETHVLHKWEISL